MFYQSTSDVFENSSRSHLSVKSQKSAGRKKSDRVLVVRRALLRGELLRRKAVAIHPDERAMRYFLKS